MRPSAVNNWHTIEYIFLTLDSTLSALTLRRGAAANEAEGQAAFNNAGVLSNTGSEIIDVR